MMWGSKMNISLYQLSNEYQEALNALSEEDFPPEAIADTLEGLKGELLVKAQNVGAFILNLDLQAGMVETVIERLQSRLKQLTNKRNKVYEYLQNNLESAGISEVSAIDGSFSIKFKYNPVSVQILEGAEIPMEYMHAPPPPKMQPDKKALKKAVESGEVIKGVYLERKRVMVIK